MPIIKSKKISQKQKLYFVYFIAFSIVVLLIFAFMIGGTFWDYWAEIREMEKFYKSRAEKSQQKLPQISNFDPIKGDTNAQITIFEYSDFICPACATLHKDLLSLEKLYGNKLRFIFKGAPMTLDLRTRPTLNAAYCAAEQNQFWPYQDLLYQNLTGLEKQKYLELASQLGLEMTVFSSCLDSNKYSAQVEQNLAEALSLQITSAPTLYLNDQKIEGFMSYDSLKNIIDRELK